MKVKLGEVCEIVSGSTPKTSVAEYWDGGIKWITPAEINDETYIVNESVRTITERGVKETGLSPFPKGTVILSSRAPIGKVAIAGCEMYCNQGFKNLICSDIINNRYLYWFLKGKTEYLNSLGRGATFKEISKQIVSEIEIDMPDKELQRNIVLKFETISRIIQLRKQELQKLDELVKARFVEMFGDPFINEKGWKMNTFGDICKVRQGLQIPISKRLTVYEDDCYEYITVQYLHGGKEREYIKSPRTNVICTKDDILMTRTGNTGMVVTGVEGVFHNNFFLIDFNRDKYDKEFLVQYLNLDFIQADILQRAGTATIPDLNHVEFYKIVVYEPPMKLQVQFANFVKQVDKSKVAIQKSLDETQLLFNSLMQEYFG
jgi:type I restriction enzyme S subunit